MIKRKYATMIRRNVSVNRVSDAELSLIMSNLTCDLLIYYVSDFYPRLAWEKQ
nr:hypothetical protein Q903MT_gene5059 [Picea sitchensis]